MSTKISPKHNKSQSRNLILSKKMLDLNEILLKINDSLIFRRFEKIDWKQIASLNMEQLKTSSDWSVIEKNLCNILCCHLESEFNQSSLDPNLCKLFQLAQISIDYLLQIRQQILSELKISQAKVQESNKALSAALKAKEQAEKKLKEWKKEGKKPNSSHHYRCPACPKTFLNGDYLHGHWQRRHPEYVTVIPPTVISSQSPVHQATNQPPITPEFPSNEITDLKARLESTEQQLQCEQQMLRSILEKMDSSSTQLQGMLAQEVEKIRFSIQEEKKDLIAEAPLSPNKAVQSAGVQTTPREFQHSTGTSTPSPERCVTSNAGTNTEVVKEVLQLSAPSPTVRSLYKPEPVKPILQVTKQQQESDESELSSASSSSEEDEDVVRRPVIQETPTKLNRQILLERFRSTIENALKQRMQMLGIDVHKKTLSSGALQQLTEKLKSKQPQTSEFAEMRKRFEMQLKERMERPPGSPSKRKLEVGSQPLLSNRKTPKQKSIQQRPERPPPMQVSIALTPSSRGPATPTRAPVPTPRLRNQMNVPSSSSLMAGVASSATTPLSLMARDGEASSVPTVKDLTRQLEIQVKERAEPPPNAVNILPPVLTDEKKANVDDEEEEDSFSLSSLDAILTELKKPNRHSQASTPSSITKSVQWRVPVETTEESWDS